MTNMSTFSSVKKVLLNEPVRSRSVSDEDSSVIESGIDQNEPTTWWGKLMKKLEVQPKGDLTTAQMFLYNHDLRPVEEARRQWSWYNYVFFWIADSFNINTWQIASTGM